ncbi:DUF29 domain-containing protein [Rhodopila sp.]|uniref:DUF29 domain-containing protein n=1 Tax=Rhodopila sp. TaxID=2480087 RepID=UPI003D10F05F
MSNLYDTDIVVWSEQQAELLRRLAAGEAVNAAVDWDNIIDEVETVGESERSRLESHIGTVVEHLIKLQASPATGPRNGWKRSIRNARRGIMRCVKRSPSLRHQIGAIIQDETPGARDDAAASMRDYSEEPCVEIDSLTYTDDQVLGDWFP